MRSELATLIISAFCVIAISVISYISLNQPPEEQKVKFLEKRITDTVKIVKPIIVETIDIPAMLEIQKEADKIIDSLKKDKQKLVTENKELESKVTKKVEKIETLNREIEKKPKEIEPEIIVEKERKGFFGRFLSKDDSVEKRYIIKDSVKIEIR